MLSNNITIESEYGGIHKTLHVEHLSTVHRKLNLKKPVIYYFVSDEHLLQINRESLQHDYYTDIITFDNEEDTDIEENEILISWERVQENAVTYNTSVSKELHRVCFHGLLHLAGFKDKTKEEQTEMRNQENLLLDLYCST